MDSASFSLVNSIFQYPNIFYDLQPNSANSPIAGRRLSPSQQAAQQHLAGIHRQFATANRNILPIRRSPTPPPQPSQQLSFMAFSDTTIV
jgi:hypothetical protein